MLNVYYTFKLLSVEYISSLMSNNCIYNDIPILNQELHRQLHILPVTINYVFK